MSVSTGEPTNPTGAAIVIPVAIHVYDAQTNVTYHCEEFTALNLTGQQKCIAYDPGVLRVASEGDSGEAIGWRETIVMSDGSIMKTCGWYKAQSSPPSCALSFDGSRRLIDLWIYHCGCSQSQREYDQYWTSGRPHNYATTSGRMDFTGMYETWEFSVQLGRSNPECTMKHLPGGAGYTGATGTINPSNKPECATGLWGVWGIGASYEANSWDKKNVRSEHHYVYEATE